MEAVVYIRVGTFKQLGNLSDRSFETNKESVMNSSAQAKKLSLKLLPDPFETQIALSEFQCRLNYYKP